jgi:hypothetical protein
VWSGAEEVGFEPTTRGGVPAGVYPRLLRPQNSQLWSTQRAQCLLLSLVFAVRFAVKAGG